MTRLNQRIDRPGPPAPISTFVFWVAVGPTIAAAIALALALLIAGWPRPAHATKLHIAKMNAALRRYVHPTGGCGLGHEMMATMYGNGDGTVGRRVACGGVLDRQRPTVASRTLHCGSKITLTNPANGRSVEATVTDYGPATIADIDLGPAVWRALRITTSTYICGERTK